MSILDHSEKKINPTYNEDCGNEIFLDLSKAFGTHLF